VVRPPRPGDPAGPDADEVRLVQQAKAGDAAAFGKLYDGCIDKVYRYVFFRVSDPQTAEDLTSEVFLKAWENFGRYEPHSSFVAWLYTIARNTVIDHYRTHKQAVSLDEIAASVGRADPGTERIELQDDVKEMQASLQYLTEEQREVLVLKFIAGLDTAEIARRLRRTEGAIRALQMRGLQALGRRMDSNGR
jgi:RNA polymerase sigma-70 factor, ECF subfamily